MFTTLGEFKRQKKSKKKGFVRHEFTFDELYVFRGMEDADPASEAKGFVLVDKKNRLTSVYLDTNENGKLNKGKDLLIASDDGFEKTLYKTKKGDLLATNSEELMRVAMSDLFGGLPGTFEFIYDTGMIFTSKKGKTLDFVPLSVQGGSQLEDGLLPIHCSMDPQIASENLEFQTVCASLGL